jgi:hypothetical protein
VVRLLPLFKGAPPLQGRRRCQEGSAGGQRSRRRFARARAHLPWEPAASGLQG